MSDLKDEETLPQKISNSSSSSTSSNNSSSNEMDDEADSCFAYKKSNSQMYTKLKKTTVAEAADAAAAGHEPDHCVISGLSPLVTKIEKKPMKSPLLITIPHVIKKTGSTSLVMPNIVSVKPSLSPAAASNPIIDKIAANLKNKLLDKPIPKVSLVNKVNVVKQQQQQQHTQCKPEHTSNPSRNILDDESLNKMYAHKLILYKLSQHESENR